MADDTCATLSLFGVQAEAFSAEAETVVAMLATMPRLRTSTTSTNASSGPRRPPDVIGQAKGIVMERFGVDATRAFAMLAAISRDTNTAVRDLAARLVDCATQ